MRRLLTRVSVIAICSALAIGGVSALSITEASAAPAHHYLAGDFDGDGHRDLVIGAPGSNRFRITYSHLLVKGSHTVTVAPSSRPSEPMYFGTAFALGDFNGDGYSDLAVSAPQYTTSSEVGAVFVYRGSKTGLHATPLTIIGPGTEDVDSDVYNVISLAGADLNSDGYTDLVVGSYYDTRVYHGSKNGLTTKGPTVLPEQSTGYTGADSLAVGDFNGDHHVDLVVGRIGGDDNTIGEEDGELDIFYGTAHGLNTKKHHIYGNKVGAKVYDNFGGAIAAGDFDGDGQLDLAVGVPGKNEVVVLAGGSEGLRPANRKIFAEESAGVTSVKGDEFGMKVAAGRITNDGYSDLVVGAPGVAVNGRSSAGEVFVIHGSASGLARSHAQHLTLASPGMPGAPTADADFGASLFVGDLAGDSRPDVLVAAPYDAQKKQQAGFVVRLLGTDRGVTTRNATSAGSSTAHAWFGTGLA